MKFSEETLMAYADRQLDADTQAAVETAMATDPELARRVASHMALARSLRAAFDPVLLEPIPQRLLDAVAAEKSTSEDIAKVIDLAQKRQSQQSRMAPRWSWPQWGALAASLVVGIAIGRFRGAETDQEQFATADNGVIAHGELEHALSVQLASTQPDNAPVKVGVSFVNKSGEYCRTFALAQSTAGMACRIGADWRVHVLAQSAVPLQSGAYRMAASDTPPAVMREVEAEISGSPLDASAEQSAQKREWRKQVGK